MASTDYASTTSAPESRSELSDQDASDAVAFAEGLFKRNAREAGGSIATESQIIQEADHAAEDALREVENILRESAVAAEPVVHVEKITHETDLPIIAETQSEPAAETSETTSTVKIEVSVAVAAVDAKTASAALAKRRERMETEKTHHAIAERRAERANGIVGRMHAFRMRVAAALGVVWHPVHEIATAATDSYRDMQGLRSGNSDRSYVNEMRSQVLAKPLEDAAYSAEASEIISEYFETNLDSLAKLWASERDITTEAAESAIKAELAQLLIEGGISDVVFLDPVLEMMKGISEKYRAEIAEHVAAAEKASSAGVEKSRFARIEAYVQKVLLGAEYTGATGRALKGDIYNEGASKLVSTAIGVIARARAHFGSHRSQAELLAIMENSKIAAIATSTLAIALGAIRMNQKTLLLLGLAVAVPAAVLSGPIAAGVILAAGIGTTAASAYFFGREKFLRATESNTSEILAGHVDYRVTEERNSATAREKQMQEMRDDKNGNQREAALLMTLEEFIAEQRAVSELILLYDAQTGDNAAILSRIQMLKARILAVQQFGNRFVLGSLSDTEGFQEAVKNVQKTLDEAVARGIIQAESVSDVAIAEVKRTRYEIPIAIGGAEAAIPQFKGEFMHYTEVQRTLLALQTLRAEDFRDPKMREVYARQLANIDIAFLYSLMPDRVNLILGLDNPSVLSDIEVGIAMAKLHIKEIAPDKAVVVEVGAIAIQYTAEKTDILESKYEDYVHAELRNAKRAAITAAAIAAAFGTGAVLADLGVTFAINTPIAYAAQTHINALLAHAKESVPPAPKWVSDLFAPASQGGNASQELTRQPLLVKNPNNILHLTPIGKGLDKYGNQPANYYSGGLKTLWQNGSPAGLDLRGLKIPSSDFTGNQVIMVQCTFYDASHHLQTYMIEVTNQNSVSLPSTLFDTHGRYLGEQLQVLKMVKDPTVPGHVDAYAIASYNDLGKNAAGQYLKGSSEGLTMNALDFKPTTPVAGSAGGIGGGGTNGNPSPTPTPGSTPTMTPTQTPVPTPTGMPSPTPIPTHTPVPTPVPIPTHGVNGTPIIEKTPTLNLSQPSSSPSESGILSQKTAEVATAGIAVAFVGTAVLLGIILVRGRTTTHRKSNSTPNGIPAQVLNEAVRVANESKVDIDVIYNLDPSIRAHLINEIIKRTTRLSTADAISLSLISDADLTDDYIWDTLVKQPWCTYQLAELGAERFIAAFQVAGQPTGVVNIDGEDYEISVSGKMMEVMALYNGRIVKIEIGSKKWELFWNTNRNLFTQLYAAEDDAAVKAVGGRMYKVDFSALMRRGRVPTVPLGAIIRNFAKSAGSNPPSSNTGSVWYDIVKNFPDVVHANPDGSPVIPNSNGQVAQFPDLDFIDPDAINTSGAAGNQSVSQGSSVASSGSLGSTPNPILSNDSQSLIAADATPQVAQTPSPAADKNSTPEFVILPEELDDNVQSPAASSISDDQISLPVLQEHEQDDAPPPAPSAVESVPVQEDTNNPDNGNKQNAEGTYGDPEIDTSRVEQALPELPDIYSLTALSQSNNDAQNSGIEEITGQPDVQKVPESIVPEDTATIEGAVEVAAASAFVEELVAIVKSSHKKRALLVDKSKRIISILPLLNGHAQIYYNGGTHVEFDFTIPANRASLISQNPESFKVQPVSAEVSQSVNTSVPQTSNATVIVPPSQNAEPADSDLIPDLIPEPGRVLLQVMNAATRRFYYKGGLIKEHHIIKNKAGVDCLELLVGGGRYLIPVSDEKAIEKVRIENRGAIEDAVAAYPELEVLLPISPLQPIVRQSSPVLSLEESLRTGVIEELPPRPQNQAIVAPEKSVRRQSVLSAIRSVISGLRRSQPQVIEENTLPNPIEGDFVPASRQQSVPLVDMTTSTIEQVSNNKGEISLADMYLLRAEINKQKGSKDHFYYNGVEIGDAEVKTDESGLSSLELAVTGSTRVIIISLRNIAGIKAFVNDNRKLINSQNPLNKLAPNEGDILGGTANSIQPQRVNVSQSPGIDSLPAITKFGRFIDNLAPADVPAMAELFVNLFRSVSLHYNNNSGSIIVDARIVNNENGQTLVLSLLDRLQLEEIKLTDIDSIKALLLFNTDVLAAHYMPHKSAL